MATCDACSQMTGSAIRLCSQCWTALPGEMRVALMKAHAALPRHQRHELPQREPVLWDEAIGHVLQARRAEWRRRGGRR